MRSLLKIQKNDASNYQLDAGNKRKRGISNCKCKKMLNIKNYSAIEMVMVL